MNGAATDLTVADVARLYRETLNRRERIFLYAIQEGHSGAVKIGLAKNPNERLATLQTANSSNLRGLAYWPALVEDEKVLHEEFAHARIRGEWFRPVPELLRMVVEYEPMGWLE